MKIAFVGNQGNNAYRLCKWLRTVGCDSHLFMLHGESLKRSLPELVDRNVKDASGYSPDWIHEYGKSKNIIFGKPEISKTIEKRFDVVVTSGSSGLFAVHHFKSIPVVHMSLGSEVTELPWISWKWKTRLKARVRSFIARMNLRKTVRVTAGYRPTILSLIAHGFQNKTEIWGFPEDVKANRYRVDSDLLGKLNEKYSEYDKIFLWLSRLNFCDPTSSAYKGPERFIEAFRQLVNVSSKPIMALIGDHGTDHIAFRKLVEDLGLIDFVEWVPHLPYWKLLTYLTIENAVVFDELDYGKGELSGITREALSVGTVVVKTVDAPLIDLCFGKGCPVIHAHDIESCYRAMNELVKLTMVEFEELKEKTLQWSQNYLDYQFNIQKFLNILQEAVYLSRLKDK